MVSHVRRIAHLDVRGQPDQVATEELSVARGYYRK